MQQYPNNRVFTKVSVGNNNVMIKAYTFMFTENYRYFLDMQVLLTTHHISLYIGMKRVQVNSGPL